MTNTPIANFRTTVHLTKNDIEKILREHLNLSDKSYFTFTVKDVFDQLDRFPTKVFSGVDIEIK